MNASAEILSAADAAFAARALALGQTASLSPLLAKAISNAQAGGETRFPARMIANSVSRSIGMHNPSEFLTCDFCAEISFDPPHADALCAALCKAFCLLDIEHEKNAVFEICLYPCIPAEYIEEHPQILACFSKDASRPSPALFDLVLKNCRRRNALDKVLDAGVNEEQQNAIAAFLYEGRNGLAPGAEPSPTFSGACRALLDLCRCGSPAAEPARAWLCLLAEQGWGNEPAQNLLRAARAADEALRIEPAARHGTPAATKLAL